MRKLLLAAVLLIGTATPAFAQLVLNVDIGRSNFEWTWTQGTGAATDQFNIKCGPASGVYDNIVPVLDPLARSFPVSGVIAAPGTYFCVVTSQNQFGESGPTNEVNFAAGFAPDDPTNFRIVAQ